MAKIWPKNWPEFDPRLVIIWSNLAILARMLLNFLVLNYNTFEDSTSLPMRQLTLWRCLSFSKGWEIEKYRSIAIQGNAITWIELAKVWPKDWTEQKALSFQGYNVKHKNMLLFFFNCCVSNGLILVSPNCCVPNGLISVSYTHLTLPTTPYV